MLEGVACPHRVPISGAARGFAHWSSALIHVVSRRSCRPRAFRRIPWEPVNTPGRGPFIDAATWRARRAAVRAAVEAGELPLLPVISVKALEIVARVQADAHALTPADDDAHGPGSEETASSVPDAPHVTPSFHATSCGDTRIGTSGGNISSGCRSASTVTAGAVPAGGDVCDCGASATDDSDSLTGLPLRTARLLSFDGGQQADDCGPLPPVAPGAATGGVGDGGAAKSLGATPKPAVVELRHRRFPGAPA